MRWENGVFVYRRKRTKAERERDAQRVEEYWAIMREKARRSLKSAE
jgi:hypothetical protein